MANVNLSKGRIDKTLLLLSLEAPAPIVKQGTKWQLTIAKLDDTFWQRAERLTNLRRDEQKQMQEYVALESGHMEFLIRALDGDPSVSSPPPLEPLPIIPNPLLTQKAVVFLRRTSLPIEPRKKWPDGGLLHYGLSGSIMSNFQAQPGKALCIWGDAGWGGLVRQGKYTDQFFSDELVEASRQLMVEWNPKPVPKWVTCIPSLRHPDLVPDFANRLAVALNLPFEMVLNKTDNRPAQKTMSNSTQQARNIDGSLSVTTNILRSEPVLLVDDMVDSRWTLTVATWLLRKHGSGAVFPLALAQTGKG